MSVQRRDYIEHRRKKRAAGVITMWWLLLMKVLRNRQALRALRVAQLGRHHERAAVLRRRWVELKGLRRTIIHLPSLGKSM